MTFPDKPLWSFIGKYFVSTADTFDAGLETMVFPADPDAKIHITHLYRNYVTGVDFSNPVEKYTRHYDSVAAAKKGHKEIVKLIKENEIGPRDLIKED